MSAVFKKMALFLFVFNAIPFRHNKCDLSDQLFFLYFVHIEKSFNVCLYRSQWFLTQFMPKRFFIRRNVLNYCTMFNRLFESFLVVAYTQKKRYKSCHGGKTIPKNTLFCLKGHIGRNKNVKNALPPRAFFFLRVKYV